MTDDLEAYFELVFPQKQLVAWERLMLLALYFANGCKCGDTFTVKLGRIAALSGGSETSARQYIRSLADKGVIDIGGFDRSGYQLSLIPPRSVPGVIDSHPDAKKDTDIDSLDFFTGRRFVGALLDRQGGSCFYSLKVLDEPSSELDHLVPQAKGLDNSYRNIVCCTFEMNKRKGNMTAEDFLRQVYRAGILSERELEDRLAMLASIRSGDLKPKVD